MSNIEPLHDKNEQTKPQHTQYFDSLGTERQPKRIYAIYQGEKHKELLPGEMYFVEEIHDHGTHTRIELQGVSDKDLNSIDFKFYRIKDLELVEWNIFADKKYEASDEFVL